MHMLQFTQDKGDISLRLRPKLSYRKIVRTAIPVSRYTRVFLKFRQLAASILLQNSSTRQTPE
jgi:hypothetical protein